MSEGGGGGGGGGDGGEVEAVLTRALSLGDDGRWQEMARLLADGLKQAPDDPYLLCWLGVAERELGNDGAAYEAFKRCLAGEPEDPQVLAIAGSGLAAFDDPDAAAALQTAALLGPEIPTTRLQYGAYLAREGLFAEALEQLEAARRLAPEDPTAHSETGVALALKGDLAAAASSFEEALSLAPDDSWNRILLGLALVELGRLDEGATELWRAAEERVEDPEAQVAAALAVAAMEWEEAALTALARAEYGADAADAALIEEARERVETSPDAARGMLVDMVAPTLLHERLMYPL
jgi:Flp pilus assembly protein TadD